MLNILSFWRGKEREEEEEEATPLLPNCLAFSSVRPFSLDSSPSFLAITREKTTTESRGVSGGWRNSCLYQLSFCYSNKSKRKISLIICYKNSRSQLAYIFLLFLPEMYHSLVEMHRCYNLFLFNKCYESLRATMQRSMCLVRRNRDKMAILSILLRRDIHLAAFEHRCSSDGCRVAFIRQE